MDSPDDIHTLPVNDEREHVEERLCPCLPMLLQDEPEDAVRVRHNSYDGREVGEVCAKALDLLGKALADHGHVWSADERDAYEHAIRVLQMHYRHVPSPGGPAR